MPPRPPNARVRNGMQSAAGDAELANVATLTHSRFLAGLDPWLDVGDSLSDRFLRSPFEPMSLSDFIYRPFETLIRPLDIPYAPLPARGPFALLLHFARMFRGILVAVTVLMMAIEGINLAVIWGISVHRGRGEREGRGGFPAAGLADACRSRRAGIPGAAAPDLPRQYAEFPGSGRVHAGGDAMAGPQGGGTSGPCLLPRSLRRPGRIAHFASRVRRAAADRRILLQHTAFSRAVCRLACSARRAVLAAGACRSWSGSPRTSPSRWWRCRIFPSGLAAPPARAASLSAP